MALRYAVLTFLALAGCVSPARGKPLDVHVVGDRTFAPFESCGGLSNEATGILVNDWRLMADRSGIHIHYTCDDWEKAQQSVIKGQADAIGGMVRSPKREESFRFIRKLVPNPPEYFYYSAIMWPPDGKVPDFSSLVQARIPIGVVAGDYAQERVAQDYPTIRFHVFPSYKDVIEAAIARQINVFVMEESVASHWLDRLGIINRFTRSPSPLFLEWLWAAVRKENTGLAAILDSGFENVRDDELKKVAETWVDPPTFQEAVVETLNSLRENYPVTVSGGTVLATYLFANWLFYLVFPLAVFRISSRLRSFDIQLKWGPIEKFAVRALVPAALADSSGRVLDALIIHRNRTILENFVDRKTVKERAVFFAPQFAISGDFVEVGGIEERRRELITRLRSVFEKPNAALLITSEGGGGKTSLACWIGRNALQPHARDKRDELIFPRITVPVILEGKIEQDLTDTIHAQIQALLAMELPKDIAMSLLINGRAFVIIDGYSELDEESRAKLSSLSPKLPRFKLIVTSRRTEVLFGGVATTELSPRKLAGPTLAQFLQAWLVHLGIRERFSSARFFECCSRLSQLSGSSGVPPLFVSLYAQLLLSLADKPAAQLPILKGVSGLFLDYVNQVNHAIGADRVPDPTVHKALRTIAWLCVKNTYQPHACARSEAHSKFEGVGLSASLIDYAVGKLGLIETIRPAQVNLRFALDPLAEFFAASHLFNDCAFSGAEWKHLFDFFSDEKNIADCAGFARAILSAENFESGTAAAPKPFLSRLNRLRDHIHKIDAAASILWM
jgi:ABC-type amino acid transport substrate-binding protein